MFQNHEVIHQKSDLALEQVPDCFSPLDLLSGWGLPAGQEPTRRVELLGREGHAVDQLGALGGGGAGGIGGYYGILGSQGRIGGGVPSLAVTAPAGTGSTGNTKIG